MRIVDPVPGLDNPRQPAITDKNTTSGSNGDTNSKKAYSTRKRRSAPRRYSPTPTWERWQTWKGSATSEDKHELETNSHPTQSHSHDKGTIKRISRPRERSSTLSSCDDTNRRQRTAGKLLPHPKRVHCAESSEKKTTLKRSSSPAVSDPKKSKSCDSTEKEKKISDSDKKNQDVRSKKKRSDETPKRVCSTRTKRSAPRRYSPTHLSDRKRLLYGNDGCTSSTARTNVLAVATLEKWAHILSLNPIVLVERYSPPSSVLPLDDGEDSESESNSGSECCTPTPSWMDESEIASYYTSGNGWDIGRCSPTPSLDDTVAVADKAGLETDDNGFSPMLDDTAAVTSQNNEFDTWNYPFKNNIAVDASLKSDLDRRKGRSSPLLDDNAHTVLKDELNSEKCNPIPSLDGPVSDKEKDCLDSEKDGPAPSLDDAITDTKNDEFDSEKCNPIPSLDGPVSDKEKDCLYSEKDGPAPSLDDAITDTKNDEFDSEKCKPIPSLDGPVSDKEKDCLDSEKDSPPPSLYDNAIDTKKDGFDSEKCGTTSSLDGTVTDTNDKTGLVSEEDWPTLSLDGTAIDTIEKNGLDALECDSTPSWSEIDADTNAKCMLDTTECGGNRALDARTGRINEKTEIIQPQCGPIASLRETSLKDGSSSSKCALYPLLDDTAAGKTQKSSLNSKKDHCTPLLGYHDTGVNKNTGLGNSVADRTLKTELDTRKSGSTSSVISAIYTSLKTGLAERKYLVDTIIDTIEKDGWKTKHSVLTKLLDNTVSDRTEKSELHSRTCGSTPSSDDATVDRSVQTGLDPTKCGPTPALDDTTTDTSEKNEFNSKHCVITPSLSDTAADPTLKTELDSTSSQQYDLTCDKTLENGFGRSDSCVPFNGVLTRRKAIAEGCSPTLSSKNISGATSRNVWHSNRYKSVTSPVENNVFSVEQSSLDNLRCSPIHFPSTKRDISAPEKETLILIRRDYTTSSQTKAFSSASHDARASSMSFEDSNCVQKQKDRKPRRYSSGPLSDDSTKEDDTLKMNPDLTAEDVFDILFGPKTRSPTSLCNNSVPRRMVHDRPDLNGLTTGRSYNTDKEPENRCLSSLSDSSIQTAENSRDSPVFSTRDVFEIVCGTKAYSPTLFRHDNQKGSPIPLNAVLPQPRKRSHSPAVSLPERSRPPATKSSRTLTRRSLSNNFEDTFPKPKRSASSLSLNDYGRNKGYSTRKKRPAPKRYSSTPSYSDETTNSSTDNGFYFDSDKKPYATRAMRSAPKRYSPTPFYDAYYYYDHRDQYTGTTKKSSSASGNRVENVNNRKVRRMSLKSLSGDSLKDDDESHWEKFHGRSCAKQCASLTIIRDTPVPRDVNDEFRAQKTAPPEVSVADSKIPDAGSGAWASEAIPARTRFGPYEGKIVPAKVYTSYAWLIRKNQRPVRCIDATEPGLSNWMRFVNCARHDGEQNLEAFQCHGNIYYKTIRDVNPHEELLVWYGNEYGRQLGIDPEVCDEKDEDSWREKNFKCPACPFAFASPLYLQSHKRVCRTLRSKPGSSKDSKASLKRRKSSPFPVRGSNSQSESVESDKPSGKSHSGPMQLESHPDNWNMFKRRSTDGFYCEMCKIHFLKKWHWERHLQTKKHGDKCPYVCWQCNKSFSAKASLTRHFRIHTEDRPYACSQCARRFSDHGNLKKHIDYHNGKERFTCSECKMSFTQKATLTKHYYRKHKQDSSHRFYCNICKKRYCDKQSLKRHQRLHNGEKPFACFICNERFTRREILKTHLKIHRIEGAK